MRHKARVIMLAVLVFLLALGLTVYPLISNYYNAKHQSEIHTQYMERLEQTDDAQLQRARELARAYNEALRPGAHDAENFSKGMLLMASEDYESQLNITGDGIMGYVEIPKIGVTLPIYHGTDADTLEIGVGHLLGSSLPVGGESTHAVLTGHSGMANQKMFSDLDMLQEGDVFYIKVLDEVLAYEVDAINAVLPYETELLGVVEGEDYCTLVTCTPFGVNTHRLLVRGVRIPYEEAEIIVEETTADVESVESTWEQQYIKGIKMGLAVAWIIGLIAFTIGLARRCE